ncbi:hypothetical protein SCLCIDRAFT_7392 [Scleroderma citrinum Foug A]|uniref:Uncharacterized protein n=1 Tax=Scleroderma citrinum Foug A TaxID=1036808 RepID=A0A0C3E4T9_9AGAM|nr:hypothetical protein SCLCIDRAFT_7392 [Scleroderma citrinum Foug A]
MGSSIGECWSKPRDNGHNMEDVEPPCKTCSKHSKGNHVSKNMEKAEDDGPTGSHHIKVGPPNNAYFIASGSQQHEDMAQFQCKDPAMEMATAVVKPKPRVKTNEKLTVQGDPNVLKSKAIPLVDTQVPNAPAPCDQDQTMGLSITAVDKPITATSAIPTIAPHSAHYTGHLIIHCI